MGFSFLIHARGRAGQEEISSAAIAEKLRQPGGVEAVKALVATMGERGARLLVPLLLDQRLVYDVRGLLREIGDAALPALFDAVYDPALAAEANHVLVNWGDPRSRNYASPSIDRLDPSGLRELAETWKLYFGLEPPLDAAFREIDAGQNLDTTRFAIGALARAGARALPGLLQRILDGDPAWLARAEENERKLEKGGDASIIFNFELYGQGRGHAIQVLEMTPGLGVDELVAALQDPDPRRHLRAAMTLGSLHGGLDRWQPAIVAALHDEPIVASQVAAALGWATRPQPQSTELHPIFQALEMDRLAERAAPGRFAALRTLAAYGLARAWALTGRQRAHEIDFGWSMEDEYQEYSAYGYDPDVLARTITPEMPRAKTVIDGVPLAQRLRADPDLQALVRILFQCLRDPDGSIVGMASHALWEFPTEMGELIAVQMAESWTSSGHPAELSLCGIAGKYHRFMAAMKPRMFATLEAAEPGSYLQERAADAIAAQGVSVMDDLERSVRSPRPRLRAGAIIALGRLTYRLRKAIHEVQALPDDVYPTGQPHGIYLPSPGYERKVLATEKAHPVLRRIRELAHQARKDADPEVRTRARSLLKMIYRRYKYDG